MVLNLGGEMLIKGRGATLDEKSGTYLTDWKWLAENGTRIIKSAEALSQIETTIYAVPAGKILYLVSATMTVTTEANVDGVAALKKDGETLVRIAAAGDNESIAQTWAPAIPFPIIGGTLIESNPCLDLEKDSLQYARKIPSSGLPTNGDLTIECWVKAESLTTGHTMGNNGRNGATEAVNMNWEIETDSIGRLHFIHEYGAGNRNTIISTTVGLITTGSWIHVAMVRDTANTDILFYVNGSHVETVGYANAPTGGSTVDMTIGTNENTNVFFDGLIDEFRVWNDMRTPTEISDNYQKELVGDEAGLAGYWKLNNDYLDETTNNNDLTAVNGPTFEEIGAPLFSNVGQVLKLANFFTDSGGNTATANAAIAGYEVDQ